MPREQILHGQKSLASRGAGGWQSRETAQCVAVRRNAWAVCARVNFHPRASLAFVKEKFCQSDVSARP